MATPILLIWLKIEFGWISSCTQHCFVIMAHSKLLAHVCLFKCLIFKGCKFSNLLLQNLKQKLHGFREESFKWIHPSIILLETWYKYLKWYPFLLYYQVKKWNFWYEDGKNTPKYVDDLKTIVYVLSKSVNSTRNKYWLASSNFSMACYLFP